MDKNVLDEFYELLEKSVAEGDAVWITPEQARPLLDSLSQAKNQLIENANLFESQRRALVRANRVFKRANKWPSYQYPNLSLLIDWLLDRSNRLTTAKMHTTLESIGTRLNSIGDLSWNDQIMVEGKFIIGLRSLIRNVLEESYQRNAEYNWDRLNMKNDREEEKGGPIIYGGGDFPIFE